MDWPLLASLAQEDRRRVLSTARRRRYARGEVLVHEGDPSDSLHLVADGRLAIRVSTADGDTAMLNVLGAGDFFGEVSLLDARGAVRSATVVALEPAETLAISAAAFTELRSRHPAVGELVLVLMARRVEDLSAKLLEAMYDGLDRRVYRRLVDLARLYADGPTHRGPVVVPLTQEHLAELVGGTRPSVNQVLQRLVGRGAVELGRGRLTVLDRATLVRLAR